MESLNRQQTSDFVQAWIAALRSGQYKQGQTGLVQEIVQENDYQELRYCCLGVCLDVAKKLYPELNIKYRKSGYSRYYTCECLGERNSAELPDRFISFINIGSKHGALINSSLIHLNDTKRQNFKQIADVIEQNQTALFPILKEPV